MSTIIKNLFVLILISTVIISCSPRATSNLQRIDKQVYAATSPSAIITEDDLSEKIQCYRAILVKLANDSTKS